MKNEIVLIEPFLKGNAVALVRGSELYDFFIDFEESSSSLIGATFVGVVEQFVKNSNSCFVKLPNGKSGFLRGAGKLKSGNKVILQSRLFSQKNALAVTTDLIFKGRYVVITPKKRWIAFSRNIIEKKRRRMLTDLGEKYQEIGDRKYGIIFRSICNISSDEKINEDIEKQLKRCRRITALKPNDLVVVEDSPKALERAKHEWPAFENQKVINETGCFDSFSIWEKILTLKEATVSLSSGRNMIIEPTQAFVAIDVNTGSDLSFAAGLKANIQAISEVPRQLRIRGLGGKIVIEMGPLSLKQRVKIESALKKNIALYSDKIRIAGWTALGNLELEKSRDRMHLGAIHFTQIEKNTRL